MTARALRSVLTAWDIADDPDQERVEKRYQVEVAPGTRTVLPGSSPTSAESRRSHTKLSLFSDGSSVKESPAVPVNVWRSIPTSAGKTFEWEGAVLEVKDGSFSARLIGVKGVETTHSEIAEFDTDEVPLGDRDLLKAGGIFRWVVGFESRSGPRQKYSRIVFRRLPAWTPRSHQSSFNDFKKLVGEITWSNDAATLK